MILVIPGTLAYDNKNHITGVLTLLLAELLKSQPAKFPAFTAAIIEFLYVSDFHFPVFKLKSSQSLSTIRSN
jgi:hypothetical protein